MNHFPVLKAINEDGYDFKDENIFISGTHTHSGPAGYFDFFLFQFTSLGSVSKFCFLTGSRVAPETILIERRTYVVGHVTSTD